MDNEASTGRRVRVMQVEGSEEYERLVEVLDRIVGGVAQPGIASQPSTVVIIVYTSTAALPPVTDPMDQKILQWVTEDPDLTDFHIGQRLGISRQAANTRRRRLQAMGYRVR